MRLSIGDTRRGAWFALAALAVLALGASAGKAQNVQYISAIVNDEVLSIHDLESRLGLVLMSARLADTPENRGRLRAQVLQRLIDEKLQVQEATRLNVKLTGQEIDESISRLAAQNETTTEGLAALLASREISLGTLLIRVRAELVWTKLLGRQLVRSISVSDEEIDEVITRLNANRGKPEYLISEIFLAVGTPDDDEDVRGNAERLAEEARRGAPFDAIAEQFSQSATASIGGEVGWVQPGQAATEVEAVLATLEVGEISSPIRAEGGYYLIKLRDRRKILVAEPFDAVVSLKQILFPLSPGGSTDTVQAKRDLAKTIAGSVKGCADFDAIASEIDTPGSGDLGTIRIGDLPPEIRDAVAGLEIGLPSPPIERESGIHVFMVCDRSTPRTGMPTREEVRDGLLRQRLALMARRYLRDLRRDAVIELR
ncbi:MAG: peptidylprolyl isomerase [Alphaproteobacteria bacterium]